MSVFQVEEYYIFINIGSDNLNDELKQKIKTYLEENGVYDFEFQDGDLVIDELDCESRAECYDRDIRAIIGDD